MATGGLSAILTEKSGDKTIKSSSRVRPPKHFSKVTSDIESSLSTQLENIFRDWCDNEVCIPTNMVTKMWNSFATYHYGLLNDKVKSSRELLMEQMEENRTLKLRLAELEKQHSGGEVDIISLYIVSYQSVIFFLRKLDR